jgi:biopolymer transport protein ExbB
MLSHIFLGMSLLGAEWVLILLVILSVLSISLIFDRILFYRAAQAGLPEFRETIRQAVASGNREKAEKAAQERLSKMANSRADLETEMTYELLRHSRVQSGKKTSPDVLGEVARDAVFRSRLGWDKNLAILATIGNNAPFIGLFGTVLGIIKAFHDLKQESGVGIQAVSSGISEALVATAVGILVAIPAVAAFNMFQRRVKTSMSEAEALKSYLIGKLAE